MKKWWLVALLGVGSMGAVAQGVTQEQVLEYWFGEADGPSEFPIHKARVWFIKDATVDRDIREKFGAAVEAAGRGKYDHWTVTPRGRLALIVLLDQFSRNLNRGKGEAYFNDERALRLALEGISRKEHLTLTPIERAFLYMPLEHSEDLHYQDRCCELFGKLASEATPEVKAPFQSFLDYAEQHREIIDRFGRFPHRNTALLRDSTPEEIEFLKSSGPFFRG